MRTRQNLDRLKLPVDAEILVIVVVVADHAVIVHGHGHLVFRLFIAVARGLSVGLILGSGRRLEGDPDAMERAVEQRVLEIGGGIGSRRLQHDGVEMGRAAALAAVEHVA